jgi:chemotaxis signal transduction protein
MTDALVACAVGNVEYALRAAEIVAVMRADRMRPPAPSEAGVGVVTIGSERASVYPLGAALGSSALDDRPKDRDRHIVVLRGATGAVGWLVDRVNRSNLPSGTRVLPLPGFVGERSQRWCGGVVNADRRTMLLLSMTDKGAGDRGDADVTDGRAFAQDAVPQQRRTDTAPLVVTFASEALPPCGAWRYAISAQRVLGVESALHVVALPGAEPPVGGISVWRGEALPVVDFRSLDATPAADARRLLIVRCRAARRSVSIAIPVDADTALHQPAENDQAADPREGECASMAPFVAGLFDVRGHTVALIDPDMLVASAFPATIAA